MKENKKGFTLVEVLLVVILLGVLLSVTLPSASMIIDKSKVNSSLISAKNYVAGIEYKFLNNQENDEIDWLFVGNSKLSDVLDSGEYPQDGIVTMYNNKVVEAKLCFFDKSVTYSNGEYSVEDTDKHCDYTSNSIAKYITNDGVDINTENIDYDNLTIDASVLTEDTKIFGVEYINPDYIEYQKLLNENPEEAKKMEVIPNKYITNTGQIKALKSDKNLAKKEDDTRVAFINNNVQKISSVTDSYYSLKNEGYTIKMEEQKELGLCWAHTSTSMYEVALQKKLGKNNTKQFSARHLDYAVAQNSFNDLTNNVYTENQMEKYNEKRTIGEGGNFPLVSDIMFTGLVLQTVDSFGDDYKTDKKYVSDVYNTNKIDYYAKKASQFDFEGYSEFAVAETKKNILENGAVFGRICSNGIEPDSSIPSLTLYKAAILRKNPEGECGPHAVTIIGWDDSVGAWIAQNSWGGLNPMSYFYIDYTYDTIYYYLGAINEVSEKKWDNSYDHNNNSVDIDIEIKNYDDPILYTNGIYINKVNGSKEKIVNIGYKKDASKYISNNELYVLNASSENNCKDIMVSIIKGQYMIENENIYNTSSQQIGFLVKTPELLDFGFEFHDITNNMVFENDICIVDSTVSFRRTTTSTLPPITIYTENINNQNSKIEIIADQKDDDNNTIFSVDTLVNNIESGTKIQYKILDSNGNSVVNGEEVSIADSVVVNNVAHSEFRLKKPYQYTITAMVGSLQSNSVVINSGNLKTEQVEIKQDKTPPKCSWSALSYKVTKDQKGKFYLTCTDESGFSDTSITKSNITIPGLIFKKLKFKSVSNPSVSSDGKTITWTVTVERGFLARGNSSLTLKEGAIADKNGNKNQSLTSRTISVSRK